MYSSSPFVEMCSSNIPIVEDPTEQLTLFFEDAEGFAGEIRAINILRIEWIENIATFITVKDIAPRYYEF
jgi:hypothetical protein